MERDTHSLIARLDDFAAAQNRLAGRLDALAGDVAALIDSAQRLAETAARGGLKQGLEREKSARIDRRLAAIEKGLLRLEKALGG